MRRVPDSQSRKVLIGLFVMSLIALQAQAQASSETPSGGAAISPIFIKIALLNYLVWLLLVWAVGPLTRWRARHLAAKISGVSPNVLNESVPFGFRSRLFLTIIVGPLIVTFAYFIYPAALPILGLQLFLAIFNYRQGVRPFTSKDRYSDFLKDRQDRRDHPEKYKTSNTGSGSSGSSGSSDSSGSSSSDGGRSGGGGASSDW